MSQNRWNEQWETIKDEELSSSDIYEISNYGQVVKINPITKEKKVVKISLVNGYCAFTIRKKNGKSTSKYVHKLVAQYFLNRESTDQKYVLHLDFVKKNNYVENLKWADRKDKEDHLRRNPNFINRKRVITNSKLTEAKVKLIKMKINDPNRKTRMKMIAKQFGISEMQLYRIKSGENWSHVKVEQEQN